LLRRCINTDLPSSSFRPTHLQVKTHATTADSIFLFSLKKARARLATDGMDALTDEEKELLKDDIAAAKAEAKARMVALEVLLLPLLTLLLLLLVVAVVGLVLLMVMVCWW
jgi:hypothetical protein